MKKIVAFALAIVMLMTLGLAVAETAKTRLMYDDKLSLDVVYPEGYIDDVQRIDSYLFITLEPTDLSKPSIDVLVCPDEEYADLERLNDLSDDALALYASSLLEGMNAPTYEVRETTMGTKAILINESGSEMDFAELITVYKGYTVALFSSVARDGEMTDDEINVMVKFMSDMDFIYAE